MLVPSVPDLIQLPAAVRLHAHRRVEATHHCPEVEPRDERRDDGRPLPLPSNEPFWQYLENVNRRDRYDPEHPGERRATYACPDAAARNLALNAPRIGDVAPVRQPHKPEPLPDARVMGKRIDLVV